jgi:hypothetical protein
VANGIASDPQLFNYTKCFAGIEVLLHPAGNTEFAIAPNPNDGQFWLHFSESLQGSLNIQIKDLLGRQVFEETIEVDPGTENFFVSMPRQTPGIYSISVYSAKRFFTGKLILN